MHELPPRSGARLCISILVVLVGRFTGFVGRAIRAHLFNVSGVFGPGGLFGGSEILLSLLEKNQVQGAICTLERPL